VSVAIATPAPTIPPTAQSLQTPAQLASTPKPADRPVQAASASSWDLATGGMAHLTLLAWLLALTILPLGALLGFALHARHRSRLLELDRPPLRDREALHRAYDWKLAEAQASAGTLQSLSYAPRYSNNVEGGVNTAMLPPARVLSLAEVLAMRGLVIGSAHEGPVVIEGEWTSVGVGGMPGSGKSITVASLAAQHAASGSRIFLADPHAAAQRRSLTSYLAPLTGQIEDTATDRVEILRMAERVYRELELRKRYGRVDQPVVLIVDEWLSLILGKDGQELAALLIRLVVEGQKSDVTVILAAQNWMAATAGGSVLRNPLPVTVAHRMRPADMRALTGMRGDVPADVLELPPGHAYATGPWGVSRVVVPHVRPEELPSTSAFHLPSTSLPPAFQNGDAEGNPELREGNRKAPEDRQERRVVGLFLDGASVPEIVQAVYGKSSSDGRAYLEAREKVEAILRRALGQGGTS
jgi:hypothetical protein